MKMKSIIRRLELVESKVNLTGIPDKERFIVIPFHIDEELAKGKEEVIGGLEQKYGVRISLDDLLILAIRKFALIKK
jgi:hypothetical protein